MIYCGIVLGRNSWKHAKSLRDCEEGTNGCPSWSSAGAERTCSVWLSYYTILALLVFFL